MHCRAVTHSVVLGFGGSISANVSVGSVSMSVTDATGAAMLPGDSAGGGSGSASTAAIAAGTDADAVGGVTLTVAGATLVVIPEALPPLTCAVAGARSSRQ
jgi:hypothetical protein